MVHLKRWTRFFETFPVGPNRSIEFWTEISGNFGWMDRAQGRGRASPGQAHFPKASVIIGLSCLQSWSIFVGKTVWMQRSTQRVNITDWFLLSDLWLKRAVARRHLNWMQGYKGLIYYRPIFRLTKLAFLRARTIPNTHTFLNINRNSYLYL